MTIFFGLVGLVGFGDCVFEGLDVGEGLEEDGFVCCVVEQDFKEFCVGGVGMLLAELLEKLGELFGFFEVGLGGVVMDDLIAFDVPGNSGDGCIEVELDFGLVGHGGDEIELGFEKTNEACLLEVMICCERRLDIVALHENEGTAIDE